MAVNFYLEKRTDKSGDAPIRVSITVTGVRFVTSTGHKIKPSKWDAARQQVRKGCTNAGGVTYSVINSTLSRTADFFTAYENECLSKGLRTDADTLRRLYAEQTGRASQRSTEQQRELTLFDYLDTFIRDEGTAQQWTRGTVQKFETLRNHLGEYAPKLTFEDIDGDWISGYLAFLSDVKGLRNSTLKKHLALLKWFLRWSERRGYNGSTDYQKFAQKIKTIPQPVIFLTWDELMRVYHYEIPANGTHALLTAPDGTEYRKTVTDAAAMEKTRDIFCFCCLTGLRYSDAAGLKWSCVGDGQITLTTKKTNDTLTIPLNKHSAAVLDKYGGGGGKGAFVFPHLTNQRMNHYLKELCELCGINERRTKTYYRGSERVEETKPKYELVSTHAGRRTFISNALMLDIPAEVIMKITGHSDYKSMKPYVDIANEAKRRAMAKFDEL